MKNPRNPSVAVSGNQRVCDMTGSSPLAIYVVEEGINEDVASGDTEPLEESLCAFSGCADKHPSYDCLMLRRILPYDKYVRASIQPSPVKNGSHSVRKSSTG